MPPAAQPILRAALAGTASITTARPAEGASAAGGVAASALDASAAGTAAAAGAARAAKVVPLWHPFGTLTETRALPLIDVVAQPGVIAQLAQLAVLEQDCDDGLPGDNCSLTSPSPGAVAGAGAAGTATAGSASALGGGPAGEAAHSATGRLPSDGDVDLTGRLFTYSEIMGALQAYIQLAGLDDVSAPAAGAAGASLGTRGMIIKMDAALTAALGGEAALSELSCCLFAAIKASTRLFELEDVEDAWLDCMTARNVIIFPNSDGSLVLPAGTDPASLEAVAACIVAGDAVVLPEGAALPKVTVAYRSDYKQNMAYASGLEQYRIAPDTFVDACRERSNCKLAPTIKTVDKLKIVRAPAMHGDPAREFIALLTDISPGGGFALPGYIVEEVELDGRASAPVHGPRKHKSIKGVLRPGRKHKH